MNENEIPNFFEEKDVFGMPKPKIPVTGNEDPEEIINLTQETNNDFEDATKTARFANYVIDCIGVLAFSFIMGVSLTFIGMGKLITESNKNFVGFILMIFYYCLLEGIMGRTLGKLVTGTEVITIDGKKPGFLKVLGRTLCRIIPFEPFSFFGAGAGGWHDTITGTRVVKSK